MGSSYTRNLKKIALSFFVVSSAFSFVSASASSPPPSESPSAETELICHTDNPADCYPKVFSATEEFQIVHDDQDLPPGLHVQLDVQTGKKQAKLYDPKEENPALEGLPVDRSVVIVDPEEPQDDKPRIPSGAPAYDPVGKVKAPKEKDEGFTQALETVKKYAKKYSNAGDYSGQSTNAGDYSGQSTELDQALEGLLDLSYDMYYGLQIAEDADTVHGLFCLVTNVDDSDSKKDVPVGERPDFLSALILASSIRNNKPALQALEKSWDAATNKQCVRSSGSGSSTTPPPLLATDFFANLSPTSEPGSAEEVADIYRTRLSLIVLEPLLKSAPIRSQFLRADGMQRLLEVLLRGENAVWQDQRPKVARIVSDTFLDEEFGAALGVWPTAAQATEDGVCAAGGTESRGDGCWEFHLERIGRDPGHAEWSRPLLDLLKRRRADIPRTSGRDEL
ncbi:uncharacterized protein F4807DRAFT_204934 [Annulohypoxylon truncatum]|uniref:uncharacterized protein n=1 Tax=Annulohypoxylon truncatum TaxID=327061 RepID=UPI0020073D1A|nr:uncharacterized protein F4807DRAFT_204934 [Annulohypoxylon truncatum]KAI1213908.1 hypothetical protein F4807DRAFT_204934 [Annulohypoxylon truncatum]